MHTARLSNECTPAPWSGLPKHSGMRAEPTCSCEAMRLQWLFPKYTHEYPNSEQQRKVLIRFLQLGSLTNECTQLHELDCLNTQVCGLNPHAQSKPCNYIRKNSAGRTLHVNVWRDQWSTTPTITQCSARCTFPTPTTTYGVRFSGSRELNWCWQSPSSLCSSGMDSHCWCLALSWAWASKMWISGHTHPMMFALTGPWECIRKTIPANYGRRQVVLSAGRAVGVPRAAPTHELNKWGQCHTPSEPPCCGWFNLPPK